MKEQTLFTKLTPASIKAVLDAMQTASLAGKEIVIVTHRHPDFDAITSMLGMRALIAVLTGQIAKLYFSGDSVRVPLEYLSLEGVNPRDCAFSELLHRVHQDREAREKFFIVAVDCHNISSHHVSGTIRRPGAFINTQDLTIDHHHYGEPENLGPGLHVVDTHAHSATYLVAKLLQGAGLSCPTDFHRGRDEFWIFATLVPFAILTDALMEASDKPREAFLLGKITEGDMKVISSLNAHANKELSAKVLRNEEEMLQRVLQVAEEHVQETSAADVKIVHAWLNQLPEAKWFELARVADLLRRERDADIVLVGCVSLAYDDSLIFRISFRTKDGALAPQIKEVLVGDKGGAKANGSGAGSILLSDVTVADDGFSFHIDLGLKRMARVVADLREHLEAAG